MTPATLTMTPAMTLLLDDDADKLNRTALMHAAMSGHAHIMSYLLNLGVTLDHIDSSGNTALHYAVGYGWYYCTKLLLDAGADPSIPNDWKVTIKLIYLLLPATDAGMTFLVKSSKVINMTDLFVFYVVCF